MNKPQPRLEPDPMDKPSHALPSNPRWVCDRCGAEMLARQCKIICPNCGNRFDCSDLNLYFDEELPSRGDQHGLSG